ncbi:hypothetical protein FJQ98_14265 [Lysinibacillus agricola]|uniref:Uncharacterized protein n=1 Tax=Lysinibacillus agricola TaxID=2590012 RepID=A0ABX7AKU3_9BACI|nr:MULTISPECIES: hypothetical protein [Lysinibacillus]KOS64656.1 hypothetical protein AN161_01135 [Lysinibacillus sp. FJAT-14222]QQP10453.1 hypothetical protein FJQ98_14265 [Lysinibacillus agricola]
MSVNEIRNQFVDLHRDLLQEQRKNKKLSEEIQRLKEYYEIVEKALFKASDKIVSFQKVFELYATPQNYKTTEYKQAEWFPPMVPIDKDLGQIARQALGGENHDK